MRTLVLYDSLYGNTKLVAEAVANARRRGREPLPLHILPLLH